MRPPPPPPSPPSPAAPSFPRRVPAPGPALHADRRAASSVPRARLEPYRDLIEDTFPIRRSGRARLVVGLLRFGHLGATPTRYGRTRSHTERGGDRYSTRNGGALTRYSPRRGEAVAEPASERASERRCAAARQETTGDGNRGRRPALPSLRRPPRRGHWRAGRARRRSRGAAACE